MHTTNSNAIAECQLPWQYSVCDVFSMLSALPWAVLLDSAAAKHPDARYDVISAWPVATVTTTGNCTQIHDANGQLIGSSTGDPFKQLQHVLAQYFPTVKTTNLPFAGGAIGCFGYDLGRSVEQVPDCAADDIAFPQMAVGLYDWALIHDNKTQVWHLVHYAGQTALTELLPRLLSLRENSTGIESPSFTMTSGWKAQITQADYLAKFEQVQRYLHSGDCYQINLTQRFSATYRGNEWQAYCALRQANAAPFSAFMRLPQGCALSISPERFIAISAEGKIQTKPIKGTAPRSNNPDEDRQLAEALLQSEKNRAENLMIVDLLRNDIGKVATSGSVKVPELFALESFPAVHHLVSTVTGQLPPEVHALTLLRAAFPGGSITGAPKVRAMEIIESLEPSRRNLYCGAMGYISQHGVMDTNIAIRTLVAANGQLHCWAGGGIVADSDGAAEYQECYDKVSRILPVLTDFKE
ncbi:aminodeoxychorismate synthase component I [Shewanella sp. A32]|uniref:aminodeoxychorismate synthase component I n=1 Tax=Shewanella sp. A32 TaxID=3031327 RepID=UPI0023B8E99E|nr:aminodeoxychorismate synthase component I [Shewanella sp. A32]MDF0534371.1 aminodeoxychorismate synthase component I [Shewanella sp. A32]